MDTRIKDLWLNALTSGEYQQGKGTLQAGSQFCCLGVLCDLHAKETGGEWTEVNSIGGKYGRYGGATVTLPAEVVDWAGLSSANPHVNELDDEGDIVTAQIAALNDNGRTFEQLAAIIKEQL